MRRHILPSFAGGRSASVPELFPRLKPLAKPDGARDYESFDPKTMTRPRLLDPPAWMREAGLTPTPGCRTATVHCFAWSTGVVSECSWWDTNTYDRDVMAWFSDGRRVVPASRKGVPVSVQHVVTVEHSCPPATAGTAGTPRN